MAKKRRDRLPFDVNGPFVARSIFLFNGIRSIPGEPFEGYSARPRRLQQLYDARAIDMAPVVVQETPVLVEEAPMVAQRTPVAIQEVPVAEIKPPLPIIAQEAPVDWRQLDEKGIFDYLYDKTGVRRRNIEIAIKELNKLEPSNERAANG